MLILVENPDGEKGASGPSKGKSRQIRGHYYFTRFPCPFIAKTMRARFRYVQVAFMMCNKFVMPSCKVSKMSDACSFWVQVLSMAWPASHGPAARQAGGPCCLAGSQPRQQSPRDTCIVICITVLVSLTLLLCESIRAVAITKCQG